MHSDQHLQWQRVQEVPSLRAPKPSLHTSQHYGGRGVRKSSRHTAGPPESGLLPGQHLRWTRMRQMFDNLAPPAQRKAITSASRSTLTVGKETIIFVYTASNAERIFHGWLVCFYLGPRAQILFRFENTFRISSSSEDVKDLI
jgi:hypothetical protein